jgi:hypothetical protein
VGKGKRKHTNNMTPNATTSSRWTIAKNALRSWSQHSHPKNAERLRSEIAILRH